MVFLGKPKQTSLTSSLSLRETNNRSDDNHHSKTTVHCMSGLLRLLHSHHRRRRHKRLTSSSTKDNKPSSAATQPPPPPTDRRNSCEVPRSPTINAELRQHSNKVEQTPSSDMSSPSGGTIRRRVVARLMGLEDGEPSPPVEKVAEEKRRRLLGALERCEEDVRALKRIIEAVHLAEEQQRRAEEVVDGRGRKAGDLDGGDVKVVTPSKELDGRDLSVIKEVPSPVSVLDVVYSPFNLGSSSIKLKKGNHQRKNHQPPKKKNETSDEGFIYRRFSAPAAGDDLFGRTGPDVGMMRAARRRLRWSGGSPAMEECVEEVGRDMEWEERWELRRVVVVLEGHIFGGLVDEIVREMGFCYQRFSFGFGKCRKRLVF